MDGRGYRAAALGCLVTLPQAMLRRVRQSVAVTCPLTAAVKWRGCTELVRAT
jgi:hypothetical protein